MKTTLLFFLLFSGSLLFAQCPTGDVNLYTQADVEEFIANYASCEIINGNLHIEDATDISGITSIKRIEGSLIISYSEITSVSNFSNLEFVGGDFIIEKSRSIETIEGINQLHSVIGNFEITENTGILKTITGFNSLNTIEGNIQVSQNHFLESISGFDNLTLVNGGIYIYVNDALVSLPNFDALMSIGVLNQNYSGIIMNYNQSLTEISGFNSLTEVSNHIEINNNDNLTKISGFQNLEIINGELHIYGSDSLIEIPFFDNLVTVGRGLEISNTGLTDINGFNNLQVIGNLDPSWGNLDFYQNLSLVEITGFNALYKLEGELGIGGNENIISLVGLSNLTEIRGLNIAFNELLPNLIGLENLFIVGNHSTEENINIRHNTSLTDCSALCNLFENGTVIGYVEIIGNPSNCSSEAEVREECTPDFDKDGILNDDDLDDDNDGILDTVEQNGDVNRDSDNDGYPDHHDLDSDNDGCYDVIESGFTDNDLNGTLGDLADTVDANGLIVGELDGYTIPRDSDVNGVFDFQEDNVLDSGSDGSLEICVYANSFDLFDSLNGTPDIGGIWTPSLSSGTGMFNPSVDAAGIYTYSVINEACGSDSSEINVTIDTLPNAGNNGNLQLCINDISVNLFDSLLGTPDADGIWSPNLASGTELFNPSVDTAGVYTYTVTNGVCGTDSAEVNVSVDTLPNAGDIGSLQICINSNTVDLFESLTGSPDTGGVWSPSLSSGTGIFNPVIDSAGVYAYIVTNGVCGTDSAEVNVTIDDLPNSGDNGTLEICVDSNIVDLFDTLLGSPDLAGVWSPSLTSGTGLFNPAIDPAGVYTYTVSNGICDLDASQVAVFIDALPNAGDDGTLEICINSFPVDLYDSLTGNTDSGGSWFPGLSSGSGIFDPSADVDGVYIYTVTNGVCASDEAQVNVITYGVTPIDDYSINIVELSDSNSIEIIINYNLEYEYSLDGIAFQNSNQFTNLIGGDYNVYVREINGCGILQEEVSILDYPKFFTPNSDGINDTWELRGRTNENYNIHIYDRYGKLLSILTPNQKSWNGTYNGENLPSSDYWFTITLGNGTIKNSHFTLKR